MHDVIRYTGLHIASKGEFDFLVKDYCGSRIDALSHDMLIEKRAISVSSKTSIMDVFPKDHMMDYLKLEILRLHGIGDNFIKGFLPHEFSACFFRGMGNLKVLEMHRLEISSFPISLGSMKNNLRTMCLRRCMVKDFTKVGELTNLEILDLKDSWIHSGLYEALQQMSGLRVLDLTDCLANGLPCNLVGCLSRLEGLYMLDMAHMDASKPIITSLVELEMLRCLEVLEVQVGSPELLTNNFISILGKFSSFRIRVSDQVCWGSSLEIPQIRLDSKVLYFKDVTMNEHQQQCLGQLLRVGETFQLVDCDGLPMVFRYGDDVSNVRCLCLFSCNDMEFVIRGPTTETELRHDQLTTFTMLEELELDNLQRLKAICTPSQYVCLSKLKKLVIGLCEMLPYAFTNLVARQLQQLKYLNICSCEGMEEIFTIDNNTSGNSPSFEGIKYEEMDDANSIVLPSLEELYLVGLEKLKVFSAKNRSHGGQQAFFGEQVQLPEIKVLYMDFLSLCEKIWESHLPKGSFGRLSVLTIINCEELRYIFPAAVASSLIQLHELKISGCGKLEEVVVVESRIDAEEEEESKIEFPRLYSVELISLSSLRSFCSVRCCTMEFPSLEDVEIKGNINMKKFSYGSLNTPKLKEQFSIRSRSIPKVRGQDYLNTIVAYQYEETKRAMGSESSESNVPAS